MDSLKLTNAIDSLKENIVNELKNEHNYIGIGTIEPKWKMIPENWKESDKDEVLAFIYGAFTKYNNEVKNNYTDMNQDLCDYIRSILYIEGSLKKKAKKNDQSPKYDETEKLLELAKKISERTIGMSLGKGVKPSDDPIGFGCHNEGEHEITPYKLDDEDYEFLTENWSENFYNTREKIDKYLDVFKDNGEIHLKTRQHTWFTLCGREWIYDKEKQVIKLYRMS